MTRYRAFFSLLLSYGLLLIGNGLFNTVIAIRSKSVGFDDSVIGLVLSAYFVGLLLSAVYAVRIVAAIGHIRAFAIFGTVASVAVLSHLLWHESVFWGLLRLTSGFCMGGMIVVTEGWLHERATNENRGTILSLYMITTYACAGAAQLILMLGSPEDFKLFIIASIVYSVALVPLLATRSQTPAPSTSNYPNVIQMYRISPVGMTGSFVVGFFNGVFYTMTPIFAYSIGLNISQTAIFIAVSLGSGMLLQLPLGKVSDYIDRRWVLVFSALMTVLACYLLYRATAESPLILYLKGAFYGCAAFSINPICAAHTNDLSPPQERTQTASGLLMLYGIGAILGPIAAGFVMPYDIHNIYLLSGGMTLLFAMYTLYRLIIQPRRAQRKKDFKPFALQSPARGLGYRNSSKEE